MASQLLVVDDDTVAELERRELVRPADWRRAVAAGYVERASSIGRRSVWIPGGGPDAPTTTELSGHYTVPGALGSLKVFGAGWSGGVLGLVGYAAGFGRADVVAAVVLFSAETGAVRALVSGSVLPVRKTAAVAAVAATQLAPPGLDLVLGIVGAGRVAESCAAQIADAIGLREIRAYRRDRPALAGFCARVGDATGLPCVAADSVAAAVEGAHVVLTATTSPSPVLHSRWLRPGALVLAMGTHYPDIRELAGDVVATARVVVDSREHSLAEKGDLRIPIESGLMGEEQIVGELGEVIAGTLAPRVHPEEIVVFSSVGLALEYVAAATMIVETSAAHPLTREGRT